MSGVTDIPDWTANEIGLEFSWLNAGPAAYQLRRLAYLTRLPGRSHQLRVAAGWLADWKP